MAKLLFLLNSQLRLTSKLNLLPAIAASDVFLQSDATQISALMEWE